MVRMKALEDELILLKKAFDNHHALLVRVLEPKHFNGVRNTKELENFVWDLEQYFKAAKIPIGEQVNLASMFLAGDAKLWWQTRRVDDHNVGRLEIADWEAMSSLGLEGGIEEPKADRLGA